MPDINPLVVIAECIEKAKATTDPELISDYIAEALSVVRLRSLRPHAGCRDGWAPESQVRSRLAAGGRWIRTIGPSRTTSTRMA
jgi:hypothetical protein